MAKFLGELMKLLLPWKALPLAISFYLMVAKQRSCEFLVKFYNSIYDFFKSRRARSYLF